MQGNELTKSLQNVGKNQEFLANNVAYFAIEPPQDLGSPLMQSPTNPVHPPLSGFNVNMYLQNFVTPITHNNKQGCAQMFQL